MKRIKIFVLALLLIGTSCVAGCGYNIKDEMINNLSDIRYNLFEAKTLDLRVTLMCGLREEPYDYNGVSNAKVEFGVISVHFSNLAERETYDFNLKVNDKEFSGELEKNPYNHNFMADIESLVNDDAQIYLSIESIENELMLVCINKNWQIQYQDALEIATVQLEEEAKKFFQKRKFAAECYLKILYDENSDLDTYLWYFGIEGQDKKRISLVIDVHSGDILAKNYE
ncbi:MAG: hypothetical protein PHV79_00885 [Clostridia bacterium]|nr:hypothetical protein [Clostridia bacterium]